MLTGGSHFTSCAVDTKVNVFLNSGCLQDVVGLQGGLTIWVPFLIFHLQSTHSVSINPWNISYSVTAAFLPSSDSCAALTIWLTTLIAARWISSESLVSSTRCNTLSISTPRIWIKLMKNIDIVCKDNELNFHVTFIMITNAFRWGQNNAFID